MLASNIQAKNRRLKKCQHGGESILLSAIYFQILSSAQGWACGPCYSQLILSLSAQWEMIALLYKLYTCQYHPNVYNLQLSVTY